MDDLNGWNMHQFNPNLVNTQGRVLANMRRSCKAPRTEKATTLSGQKVDWTQ
jgi:hypothetical protein